MSSSHFPAVLLSSITLRTKQIAVSEVYLFMSILSSVHIKIIEGGAQWYSLTFIFLGFRGLESTNFEKEPGGMETDQPWLGPDYVIDSWGCWGSILISL